MIVTSNHDMMLICAEARQRFVRLDPRGRQLSARQQVILVFTQIEEWQRLLDADAHACVHARRTRCDPISSEEAVRLARRRMRGLQRRQRATRGRPDGGLLEISD